MGFPVSSRSTSWWKRTCCTLITIRRRSRPRACLTWSRSRSSREPSFRRIADAFVSPFPPGRLYFGDRVDDRLFREEHGPAAGADRRHPARSQDELTAGLTGSSAQRTLHSTVGRAKLHSD